VAPAARRVRNRPAREKGAAVAPRGKLRAERLADPDEVGSVTQAREPDIVGGESEMGAAKEALAFFDDVPAILEGA
jgi:hypothetical protein